MRPLIEFVARNPKAVLVLTLVIFVTALVPASSLHLQLNLGELLPDDSPSANAYKQYLALFGGTTRIFVMIRQPDHGEPHGGALLSQAALTMMELMRESREIRSARAGVTEEDRLAFLAGVVQRAPLLIPGPGWRNVIESRISKEAIHKRVHEIKASVLVPWGSPASHLAVFDPLGFSYDVPGLLSIPSGINTDLVTSTFVSSDSRSALVILEPQGSELDSAAGKRIETLISQSGETVNSELRTSFRFQGVGGPLYASHDEEIIRTDLELSLLATGLLSLVLLVSMFGGLAIPVAGLASLAAGLIVVAATVTLKWGGVSAIAIGFAAVLVGIGVDIAIHGGVAFRRKRLQGLDNPTALQLCAKEVAPAIAAASLTTIGAFAVLTTSSLPVLREVGALVSGGMIVIVLSTATLGGAIAVLFTRRIATPSRLWIGSGILIEKLIEFSTHHPRTVLLAAGFATIICLPQAANLEIEPSLEGLRPRDHRILRAEKDLNEHFGIGGETATVLVRGKDLDEAIERAKAVKGILESTPGAQVVSPIDRLIGPSQKAKRLAGLTEVPLAEAIREFESELKTAGLNPAAFAPGLDALAALASGRDPNAALALGDIQVEADSTGSVWISQMLRARKDLWPTGPPPDIKGALNRISPDILVASVSWVGDELRHAAANDLRRLSKLSLLLVGLIVLISVRGNLARAAIGLSPVTLGTIWTLGIWSTLNGSLDIVGVAVLPILLGIGIDDGLHAVHGGRSAVNPLPGDSIRESGRAMLLTSVTTAVAFGSMVSSHLPALQSLALLVPLGVGSCLMATYLVIPAMESIAKERGWSA